MDFCGAGRTFERVRAAIGNSGSGRITSSAKADEAPPTAAVVLSLLLEIAVAELVEAKPEPDWELLVLEIAVA